MRIHAPERYGRNAPNSVQQARAGFTLIEVLITIIIISVLIALLLPAVNSARQTVRNAQVRTEITELENAIADFKLIYGRVPPSRVTLYEDATQWDADNYSRSTIRSIWPNFDFTLDRDLDNDGDVNATPEADPDNDLVDGVTLRGAECLVFFLGGMIVEEQQIGFSKNPANPFFLGDDANASSKIDQNEIDRSNREGPFFEFVFARLVNIDNNGVFEYVDPLANQTQPYVYLSSYDGQAYVPLGPDGLAGEGGFDDDGDTVADVDGGGGPDPEEVGAARALSDDDMPPGTLVDIYRQTTGLSAPAWKNKSFQIISPGPDGIYGAGGRFDDDAATYLVDEVTAAFDSDGNGVLQDRSGERDNITNFNGGPLAP